jgi:hypothetical protein
MATDEQQANTNSDVANMACSEGSLPASSELGVYAESSEDQQPQADAALTAAADETVPGPAQEAQMHQHSSTASNEPALVAAATGAVGAADPTTSLLHVISFNAAKRNNLHLLDDDTLLMGVGCMVLLLHLPTMKQRWLPGRDGGGVAAVAVHPSRQHFLVAERCKSRSPNM